MSGPISVADVPAVEIDDESVDHPTLERLPSRETTVGGIPVRRALPKRQHRTIGAWCFVDHFGPASPPQAAMEIGPHPHIGLQTVTWLLDGEVVHHDSIGSEQTIRPGQLNLMTAGRGVAHAEQSTARQTSLHGVQLWVAQPDTTRHGEPAFEHHSELPRVELGPATATVLAGELLGRRSPARTDTALAGYSIAVEGGAPFALPLEPAYEYGLVVLRGRVGVGPDSIGPGELAYLGCHRDELVMAGEEGAHVLVLGGEPFREEILMWWNFVARSRDEIDEARRQWEGGGSLFAPVESEIPRIPAPATAWKT